MKTGGLFLVLALMTLMPLSSLEAAEEAKTNPCEELKANPSREAEDACALYLVEKAASEEKKSGAENPCELLRKRYSRETEDACALYILESAVSATESGNNREIAVSVRQIALSDCDPALNGSSPLESEHRAHGILARLLEKTELQGPVRLCAWETGFDNKELVGVLNIEKRAIGATRYVYAHFSDVALRGFIGHELGHVVCGHKDDGKNDTEEEFAEADAVAIRLAGEDAIRAALLEFGLKPEAIEKRISNAKHASQCN